ncbi:hypothetical protein [Croceibacterium aestuarii]|uniref:hypothetical protein n=1 Tax=Croceibacterium aestuarii TaxID=3064139 RepID=UPI00272DFA94|nr:hypothetical protein [Croceibacterium sp. D39]
MTVYGLLIALMLVMKLAPDSPLGNWLLRHGVERPLERLGSMRRHHLIFAVLFLALLAIGGEMIVALGSADLFVLYALDLSLYIDGMLAVMAAASVARSRTGFTLLRAQTSQMAARLRRVFGQRRKRRRIERPRRGEPTNDDEHPATTPVWKIAA